MRKLISGLFVLAGILAGSGLTSCSYDKETGGGIDITENTLRVKFTVPGSGISTRSVDALPEENHVTDMVMLLFEPTTNGTGRLLGTHIVDMDEVSGNDGGVMKHTEFTVPIRSLENGLSIADAYSIRAFANMAKTLYHTSSLTLFLNELTGMTENQVVEYLTMKVSGSGKDQNDDNNLMPSDYIPMAGAARKSAGSDETIDLKLIRTVSRFDVVYGLTDGVYSLSSVSIWNAFPEGKGWDAAYTDYTKENLMRYYGLKQIQNNRQIGGLYAFENVSTDPSQNDGKTTCLIIGLTKTSDNHTYYYRVNINANERGQYLKRNNVYQVTINNVYSDGARDEYEAYTNGKMDLDVSINSWDRDEDGLIIRDGDNLLALPTRVARFSPEAETRQYYVYTLGTGTLELEKLTMPDGMDAWLQGNDLFISVTDYPFEQRKGSIELRFAGMKGTMEIVQSGDSEKFLRLSHTNIGAWPAGFVTDIIGQNPIQIESSGPWTASILLGTSFTFQLGGFQQDFHGVNGGYINAIYTVSQNGEANEIKDVCIVTLDEDPSYSTAFVLVQSGTGGFSRQPTNNSVTFTAEGNVVQGGVDEFTVFPSSVNDQWRATVLPGSHMTEFNIIHEPDTEKGGSIAGNGEIKGPGKFRIECDRKPNYYGVLTATVGIIYNGVQSSSTEIVVTQNSYSLDVTPNSLEVPYYGGAGTINVNSLATGQTWKATFTANPEAVSAGLVPYFCSDDKGTPITNGSGQYVTEITGVVGTDSSFKVWMPGIITRIGSDPYVNVLVELVGSTLSDRVNMTQKNITYLSVLNAQSTNDEYGSFNNHKEYFRYFIDVMKTGSYYGPYGTVWAPTSVNVISGYHRERQQNARIINVTRNIAAYPAAHTSLPSIRTASDSDFIVWVLCNHYTSNETFTVPGFPNASKYNVVVSTAAGNGASPIGTYRTISTNPETVNTELYKWLFNDPSDGGGPFGPVNASSIRLRPAYDNGFAELSAWDQNSFIPLILDPGNGRAIIGVDPAQRIIWIGDTELFASGSNSNDYSVGSEPYKFLQNLIAWMVNATQYGEAFVRPYRIDL